MGFFDDPVGSITGVYDEVSQKIGAAAGIIIPADLVSQTLRNGGIFPSFPGGFPSIPGIPKVTIPSPFDFIKNAVEGLANIIKNLADNVLNKLDSVITGGAAKLKEAGLAIADKFSKAANDIISRLSGTFDNLIKTAIEKIQEILNDAYEKVKSLLGTTNEYVKDRLDQVGAIVAESIEHLSKIAEKFSPGEIETKLVKPAIDELKTLEKQLFEDINQVIDKIISAGEQLKLDAEWKASLVIAINSNLGKLALKSLSLSKAEILSTEFTRFHFWEVYLNNIAKTDSAVSVEENVGIYAELQKKASLMSVLNKGSLTAVSQNEIYSQKWLEYGILYNRTKEFVGSTATISTGNLPTIVEVIKDELENLVKKILDRNK
jgi:gas vesicle protein